MDAPQRIVSVWFPDWPVLAAGFAADVPAAVMRANRVVARTAAAAHDGVVTAPATRRSWTASRASSSGHRSSMRMKCVRVDNGIATLTGTVDSRHERESAEENAFEGGAVRVINRLAVGE